MDVNIILIAAAALIGIGLGAFIAFMMIKKSSTAKANSIIIEAEQKAEIINKDKMIQAKEKFFKVFSDENGA
jgi:ribonuclease Y